MVMVMVVFLSIAELQALLRGRDRQDGKSEFWNEPLTMRSEWAIQQPRSPKPYKEF